MDDCIYFSGVKNIVYNFFHLRILSLTSVWESFHFSILINTSYFFIAIFVLNLKIYWFYLSKNITCNIKVQYLFNYLPLTTVKEPFHNFIADILNQPQQLNSQERKSNCWHLWNNAIPTRTLSEVIKYAINVES